MTWRKELETLLVQLRLAAVDAYMRNRGTMKEEWRARGEFYVEDRSTLPIVGEPKLCRRPDEQGYGGGELYEQASERLIGSDRYVVKFRDIQSQIDRIVDPWYHLPDPALIGEAVVAYRNVLEDLSVGVNEYTTGKGSLVPNMTRIWDELIGHEGQDHYVPALAGGAIDAFKEYVRNLDCAIGGCAGMARSLVEFIVAQQGLWTSVRQNVVTVVSEVTAACETVANAERSRTGIDLAETGLVLGVASEVPGPVGKTATAAGALLTLGTYLDESDVRADVMIDSCDSAIDALDRLLNTSFYGVGVNVTIGSFERLTCSGVATNIQEVDSQRSLFDLTPRTIDTVSGVIRHDQGKANNIVDRLDSVGIELGNVAGLLSDCVGEVQPARGPQIRGGSILERDHQIGIGRTGPSEEIVTLTDLLRMMLTGLSEEVDAGAENLRSALDALDGFNSQTAESLAAAAEAYALSDQGSLDSFDFSAWTPAGRAETQGRDRLMDAIEALRSGDGDESKSGPLDSQGAEQVDAVPGSARAVPEGAGGLVSLPKAGDLANRLMQEGTGR